MKAQQKALLASIVVLAILLSSFGGVTYSWFTDEHEIDVSVGTATLGVVPNLIIDCEEGAIEKTRDLGIAINDDSTAQITLELKNNGTVPVNVSAEIVLPRYVAFIRETDMLGNTTVTEKGLVFAVYDESGQLSGFDTNTVFFNGESKRSQNYGKLLFGEDGNKMSYKQGVYYNGTRTFEGIVCDGVKLNEYYYDMGSTDIAVGADGQLSIKITVDEGIHTEMIRDMKIRITTTISTGTQSVDISGIGHGSANVDGTKDLFFIDTSFSVKIDQESFVGIETVEIIATTSNDILHLSLLFKNGNNEIITPVQGLVTIRSSDGTISATVSASIFTATDNTFSMGR